MRTPVLLAFAVSIVLAMASASAVALDMKTESSRFTILQDGKKIGTEKFSISTKKGGGYVAEGETKLTAGPSKGTYKCRMELDEQLRPTFYEYRRDKGVIRMRIHKDGSEYEVVNKGETATIKFQFPENGFIVDNNFFHHIQLLLYRSNRKPGEMVIFVPQGFVTGSTVVTQKDPRTFELDGEVALQVTVDPADGRVLKVAAPERKIVVER